MIIFFAFFVPVFCHYHFHPSGFSPLERTLFCSTAEEEQVLNWAKLKG